MARVQLKRRNAKETGGLYFSQPSSGLRFIPSGCSLLDLVVSGGTGGAYALGRMFNIIGDKSTGKTLLAIEACANFARNYPKGKIYYREAESAFDKSYAGALGMPLSRVEFVEKSQKFDTVEDFYHDLKAKCAEARKKKVPALYIVDSLDALSTEIDMGRVFGEQTYRTDKPAMMGELFRKLIREVEAAEMCLIIISQVRANIGARFGDKTSRSGGKALDFYASAVLKLAHLKTLVQTRTGVKRATAVRIKAKCTKNKLALPFRECEFTIRFGYGVEDYEASLEWLIAVKRTKDLGLNKKQAEELLEESVEWDSDKLGALRAEMEPVIAAVWQDIETDFLPSRKKY